MTEYMLALFEIESMKEKKLRQGSRMRINGIKVRQKYDINKIFKDPREGYSKNFNACQRKNLYVLVTERSMIY